MSDNAPQANGPDDSARQVPATPTPPGPPVPPSPPVAPTGANDHLPPPAAPYGQPGQGSYPPPPPAPLTPEDERTWSMLSYLLAIIAGFLAPLVIYFIFRDRSEVVKRNSREALNLQITAIIVVVALILVMIFGGISLGFAFPPLGILIWIGCFVLLFAYSIFVIVIEVIAALRVNNGEDYQAPYILRLVK